MNIPYLSAALSGILFALSFPYPNLYFLAWVSLVPLMASLHRGGIGKAALLGFVAGLVGSLGVIYWIYPTIYDATQSVIQSAICLLLLAGYLSLYVSLWAAIIRFAWMRTTVIRFSLFAAALWVSLEFLRSKVMNGFSWAFVGYSQADCKPLLQLAAYGGVFGISFLVVLVNGAIAQSLVARRIKPLAIIVLSVVLLAAEGNILLHRHMQRYQPAIVVAGLQGNIDQYKKFDAAYRNEIREVYSRLARDAAQKKPAFIVWPETAVPGLLPDEWRLTEWLRGLAAETGTFHLVGAAYHGEGEDVYNASLLIGPDGKVGPMHSKTHLVIFGEYVPFRSFFERYFGVLNSIGELKRGTMPQVFKVGSVQCGPNICSENFFGDGVRKSVLGGAEILANQTNDAWYGVTAQQRQHFAMDIFRAVENRRAVVVAANTGVSGIISPAGMVSDTLPEYHPGYFAGKAAIVREMTFYTVYGDLFAKACAVISSLIVLALLFARLKVKGFTWVGKVFGRRVVPG